VSAMRQSQEAIFAIPAGHDHLSGRVGYRKLNKNLHGMNTWLRQRTSPVAPFKVFAERQFDHDEVSLQDVQP
jgi:hypothetical protein